MLPTIPKSLLESSFQGKIIAEMSGNSGQVYIVDHGENVHPRKVAFKTFKLKKELTEKEIGYFLDECELWFKIQNPYVVVPFYAEIISGVPFLCMPFCDTDLKSLMLDHEIDEVGALALSCRLIKAVVEMRKSGIVQHQDFNPPNVLVQDLSGRFPDHPKNHMINYDLKIADFGIANLREKVGPTIGGGGGKSAFKAPEQYDTHKYSAYEPDIFALGITLYMLLTGKHPNGFLNDKALNPSTKGKYFKRWAATDDGITYPEPAIENIINRALRRDPVKRPTPEELLEVFLDALRLKDEQIYDFLTFRFDYQDYYHQFSFQTSELHNLAGIALLPGKRGTILHRFMVMLNDQQAKVNGPQELIYYGRILQYAARVLNKHDVELLVTFGHAESILRLLVSYGQAMTGAMQYPSLTFRGTPDTQPLNIRDYEVPATHATTAITLMDGIRGADATREFFEQLDDSFLWSLYYYHYAALARQKDIEKTISLLELAKNHWPDESVFDYMVHLWVESHILLAELNDADQTKSIDHYRELSAQAIRSARAQAPNWRI